MPKLEHKSHVITLCYACATTQLLYPGTYKSLVSRYKSLHL